MLKLYFGHLVLRAVLFEKTLMLRKVQGWRRRGRQRMRWLDGVTDSVARVWVNSGSWWWTGRPGVLQFMGSQRVRHNWVTELNWLMDGKMLFYWFWDVVFHTLDVCLKSKCIFQLMAPYSPTILTIWLMWKISQFTFC